MKARKTFCLSLHPHPSASEAQYCNWLYARKQLGEIRDFKLYPSVNLPVAGKIWKRWKVDFMVTEKDGSISYHESKGWNRSDDVYRLKRDVFILAYPDIKLFVNKELYTGRPTRKSVRWRASLIKKLTQRRQK